MNGQSTDSFLLSRLGLSDRTRWRFLRYLRCSPKRDTPSTAVDGATGAAVQSRGIQGFPMSPLDRHVLGHCNRNHGQAREYRRAVTAILVSDYVAFGMPELLDALEIVVRFALCYSAAGVAMDWIETLPSPCAFPDYTGIRWFCDEIHSWWFRRKI